MDPRGHIDREKGVVDILERVSQGLRPEYTRGKSHVEVIDLGARPWLGGTTSSAVEVQPLEPPHDDEPGD